MNCVVKISCPTHEKHRCPKKLHRLTMKSLLAGSFCEILDLECSLELDSFENRPVECFLYASVTIAEKHREEYYEKIRLLLWAVLENYDSYE